MLAILNLIIAHRHMVLEHEASNIRWTVVGTKIVKILDLAAINVDHIS